MCQQGRRLLLRLNLMRSCFVRHMRHFNRCWSADPGSLKTQTSTVMHIAELNVSILLIIYYVSKNIKRIDDKESEQNVLILQGVKAENKNSV